MARTLASLVSLKERLNSSRLVDNGIVRRIDLLLVPLFNWTQLSPVLNSLSRRIHSIVAQDNGPQKQEAIGRVALHEYAGVSTVTRLGFVFVTLTLIVGSWLWLANPPATAETAAPATDIVASSSLAIVNPANVAIGNADAGSGNEFIPDSSGATMAIIAAMTTPQPSAQTQAGIGDANEQPKSPQIVQISSLENRPSSAGEVDDSSLFITRGNDSVDGQQSDQEPRSVSQLIAQLPPTPTRTAEPTVTPTEENIPSEVPLVKLIPILPVPSATPTATASATPTITPTPLPIMPGALWSTFVPGPAADIDHFWIGRPFLPSARTQLASPNYQFGSTASGRYRIHHGLDISNSLGTPVRAATEGEVVHAGPDDSILLAPFNNFYGNSVVVRLNRRLPVAGGEVDVYVLFGHLSQVMVQIGQQVTPDDIVGLVGMTGIAIGPHLHLEVRVGANNYDSSVNPYLWMQPREGSGVVAVRLLTADGRTWPGGRVSLMRFGNGGRVVYSRQIEIYLDDEPLGPDPRFGENGALGSVPAGQYILVANVNGENIRREITVTAGQSTFIEIRTQQ